MILVYAFSNQWGTNISRRVLAELEKILGPAEPGVFNFQIVYFSPQRFFDKNINGSNYDLIVGLGNFNGNIFKIRMETVTHNRFGDRPINPLSPYCLELSMPEMDIVDSKIFGVGENMGSYNCNFLAYKIQEMINRQNLNLKQLFFHIGKRSEAKMVANNIANLMVVNKMIK